MSDSIIIVPPGGHQALYDAYNKLHAEAAGLRADLEQSKARHKMCQESLASVVAERDALRGEVERACCRGEPHTCDQERVAAAEGKTDRLIIELAEVRARLAEREAQLNATRKPLDIDCTDHVELNGHIEIAEQALDWMAVEMRGDAFDTKVQDFRKSLRIVIDQCEKQRRRANWYICAYDAGRAKLVEHWQAETAETIARWLEVRADVLEAEGNSNAPSWRLIIEAIRAHRWKETR